MALAMIEGAEARGVLRPGVRVVEFTGGSTGSSLAMVCAAKGYRFVVLSSDAFSREKLLTMQAFGAELRMVPSDGGKVTPALFERFKKEIAVLASEPDTFWTDQFHNEDAVRGYMGIGHELWQQSGGRIDAFCAAVGTGGLLRGVARALRDEGSRARIVALEPASSPALTEGAAARTASRASAPAACRRTWRIAPTTKRAASTKPRRERRRSSSRATKACWSARRAG